MKRYIRASYDSSMPDWMKSDAGFDALNQLKYMYAISEAKFYDTPQEGSIPIYLLDDTYKDKGWGSKYKTPAGQYVYIPNVSSNRYLDTGKSYKHLSTAAKSRIAEHTIDTVYMVAPLRNEIQKERNYDDPRAVWNNGKYSYAGQYPVYDRHYDDELGKWVNNDEPTKWSTRKKGYGYGWGSHDRDKSGYAIPNPDDLYARLYKRFPERLKSRLNEVKSVLDEYYDKLNDAKNEIFSQYDIRKGETPYIGYGESASKSRIYRLNQAIGYYGQMYRKFEDCIDDDGSVNPVKLAKFMKGSGYDSMASYIADIDTYLNKL